MGSRDGQVDPALGHPDDFPDDFAEHGAGEQADQTVNVTHASERGSDERVDQSRLDGETTVVVGVPLMDGEKPVHTTNPSWWKFIPELLTAGLLYGVVASLMVWLYTPFIQYEFPPEIVEAFNNLYATAAGAITELGYPVDPSFSIPWWVWVSVWAVVSYPVLKAYLKARFTHYVITNKRVMSVRTFPGKHKDSAKLMNIKSFTYHADFLEQRLKVGSLKFQPANEDPIVFTYIRDYEYWETKVKELDAYQEAPQTE